MGAGEPAQEGRGWPGGFGQRLPPHLCSWIWSLAAPSTWAHPLPPHTSGGAATPPWLLSKGQPRDPGGRGQLDLLGERLHPGDRPRPPPAGWRPGTRGKAKRGIHPTPPPILPSQWSRRQPQRRARGLMCRQQGSPKCKSWATAKPGAREEVGALVGFSSGPWQGGRSGHWPLLWKLSSVQPLLVTAGGQRGEEDQPPSSSWRGETFSPEISLPKGRRGGGGEVELAPRKAPGCQASPLASPPPEGLAGTPNPHQGTWGGEGDTKPGGEQKEGGGGYSRGSSQGQYEKLGKGALVGLGPSAHKRKIRGRSLGKNRSHEPSQKDRGAPRIPQ